MRTPLVQLTRSISYVPTGGTLLVYGPKRGSRPMLSSLSSRGTSSETLGREQGAMPKPGPNDGALLLDVTQARDGQPKGVIDALGMRSRP